MGSTMALALGLGLNGGAGNSAGGNRHRGLLMNNPKDGGDRWQQLVKPLHVIPVAAPAP